MVNSASDKICVSLSPNSRIIFKRSWNVEQTFVIDAKDIITLNDRMVKVSNKIFINKVADIEIKK